MNVKRVCVCTGERGPTQQCQILHSGDHRLPSNHKCSHWNQVTKDLVQCDDCQQLIQAPKDAKLGLEQAVSWRVA